MNTPGHDGTEPGRLAENIMHFGRVLRSAGLPVGPGKVIEAVRAVEAAGISRRDDFYWALHAVFVNRRDQREVFDQAFHIFWRNPKLLEKMMSLLLPSFGGQGEDLPPAREVNRRVSDALFPGGKNGDGAALKEEVVFDMAFTYSGEEALRQQDFESMSAEELAEARRAIARMTLPIMCPWRAARRTAPQHRGRTSSGAHSELLTTIDIGIKARTEISNALVVGWYPTLVSRIAW